MFSSAHLLVFVSVFTIGLSLCPAGWAQGQDKCYFIFQDKLDKSSAASLCDDHAAELVTFANENEWSYISQLIKSVQLDSGAWTSLTYNTSAWNWPGQELHHWKNSQNSHIGTFSDPNYVPKPDFLHSQAKIIIVGSMTYLMVELATTQLYPFCQRGVDSRDLCDTNEDWINMLHVCHKYYPPATWSDAISTCSDLGGDVYSPGGPEEFIPADELTSMNTSIWIGASYKNSGYYYEADNRPVWFLPWLNPDSNYSNPNQTCIAGLHIHGLAYYMNTCSVELAFICRKPVGTCPLGWYQDGTKCYKLHIRPEERMTWFMAVDYCRSHNATIAQELSKEANTQLYNVLIENDVHLSWLGFSGSDGIFKYLDGSRVWGSYYLFDTTITSGGPSHCGVTNFDPIRNGLSLASYCYTPQPFVCTISMTDKVAPTVRLNAGCEVGWIPFAGQCYQLVMYPMTYSDAVDNCKSFKASIFIVNSTMQQSFFSTSTFMSYGEAHYWIGVKYDIGSSQYVLQDTDVTTNYWNFDPNQQYNSSYAPCVYVSSGSNPPYIGSWFREQCSTVHNSVCQMAAQPPTQQPSILPTLWSSQCGPGWIYINTTNLCYFVSPYVHKPWREARADCQSRYGDLLSISGDNEQTAIENLLKTDSYISLEESLWIGAGDLTEQNGWGWSDTQPFQYLHWAEGEPQYDSDDGDNCGYIPVTKYYDWETRSCGDKLGFICKKSASQVNSGQPPSVTPPLNCQPQPLISGTHSIQFPQDFSASSFKDAQHTPDRSRMVPFNNASWSPANDSIGEWLAITFTSPVSISDIQLRGESKTDKYVTKFKLQYQYDEVSPWYWNTNSDRSVQIFDGVSVPDSSAAVYLVGEIQAHAIKFWPVEWSYGIAVQLEVNGCPEEECVPDYAMSGPLFVDDRNIRASSESVGFETWNARLKPARTNQQLTAWMPVEIDTAPWIEVDLGKEKIIQGIVVAGDDKGNYVTQLQLLLSRMPGGDDFITYSEPYGNSHTFSAQIGVGQTTTLYMASSVKARVARIKLLKWQGQAALKFDVLVCSAGCTANPMIANLPNNQLSSSDTDSNHRPSRSKLNTQKEGDESDCWKPLVPNIVDASYIQADLGVVMQVTAVATQGSEFEGSWVTSYNLAFSTDGETFRRYGGNVTFYTIANAVPLYNQSVVYPGNFDGSIVVKNELSPSINARYIQLWPHSFHKEIALRWEVYACSKHTASTPLGCYADEASDPDLPFVPPTDQYASMWPEACLSFCYDKGYSYAGLQNGDLCSCGNVYGMYGVAQGCNLTCQDPYSNFTCGGLSQNMIYSTGISANSFTCPSGWTVYKSSCYSLFDSDTWSNARAACTKVAAHLVDISDKGENDLVASIVGDDSYREFVTVSIGNNAWIGLNDATSSLHFQWSSGADVNFTNWGRHQPTVNTGLGQHSVIISPDSTWKNTFSDSVYPFVCETGVKPSNNSETDTQYVGCLPNWRAGDFKCYRFYRQKKSWSEAQTFCASQNASLARADNSKENIVLSSALSQLDGSYWLDIGDDSTGLYTHRAGKSDVQFANWARQKPDSNGSCVSIQTAFHAGEWSNEACLNRNRFVCEQPRIGYYPRQVVTAISKRPCAAGWELHGTFCYQFNSGDASSQLSWHEANENCMLQGATLASFHRNTDFDDVVAKISQSTGNFWIGLNNLDSSTGFQWSNGLVMNFIRWGNGQPITSQILSVCGEILLDTKTMGLQFCTEKRNWICSIQQGKAVTNITTFDIPPTELGACRPLSNNWYKYKDYCYYISTGDGDTDDALTWRESQEWCKKQGADLASVASADENAFLRVRLNQEIPVEAAWIGLNDLDRNNGYSWSDGTPIGTWQMNWNVNEPDDYNGFEGCVEMLARNGRWNDIHCSTRQGFVCKQPVPGSNVTTQLPVTRHTGNCPAKFHRLGYKCYRLMGVNGDLDKQSWTDAQSSCKYMMFSTNRNYSIDLASVTTQEENAFITTLLNQHKLSAWLGLRRIIGDEYMWADNEDLGFEGWSRDEPNMTPGNDSCVYIYGTTNYVGKWNDVPCEEKYAYVCQGFVDPAFPLVVVPPSSQCNVSDGFQQFGTSCYKTINETVSWSEAKTSCSNSHAYLATIMDGYDWAEMYLLSHAYSDGVWIGLNDLVSQGVYTWDSSYPVTFTRWAHHQPRRSSQNGGCVYMDSSGLFSSSLCAEQRAYVCRSDANPPQEIPPEPGNFCSNSDFSLYNSTCIMIILNTQLTYEMAGRDCEQRGATLTSLHDPSLSFSFPATQGVWIGLRESIKEGFSWDDSTILAYTNWATNYPIWSGDEAVEESCVIMLSDGNWTNVDCENKYAYFCAAPAILQDAPLTLPPINGDGTELTPTLPTTPSPVPYSQESPPAPSPHTSTQKLSPHTSTQKLSPQITTIMTAPSHDEDTTTHSIHGPTAKSQEGGKGDLSAGQTAGIVIGVLALVTICGVIIFILYRSGVWKSSFLRREASRVKNFENSLYAETRKDTLTKSENIDGINIVPLDAGARELSVSYSVNNTLDEYNDIELSSA